VIELTLGQVAAATGGVLDGGAGAADLVTGRVRIDSRAAGPGDLFVALPGEHVDGHDYASAALTAGAAAVLASRPVGGPAVLVDDPQAALGRLARVVRDSMPGLTVVGVTGSSGKTSTKDLLEAVLSVAGPAHAPKGSYNNEIGVPLTILDAGPATRFLVAELGARGIGHIRYLCGIARPDVGLVLNVGAAHAGEFGGRAATAQAKGELVEALDPGGLAVLNADDPLVAAMAGRTRARVVLTSTAQPPAPGAAITATQIELDDQARASFILHTPAGQAPVRLLVHGVHQVANALAAAAAGLEAGLTPEQIARALSDAHAASRWRMEVTRRADGLVVVNDAYNANPESMTAALNALASMHGPEGGQVRRIAVLGEMLELGTESAAAHQQVGRLAASLGIHLIAVGPGAAGLAEGAATVAGAHHQRAGTAAEALGLLAGLVGDHGAGNAVLVKASRSVGLEHLADALLEMGTVSTDGAAHR
jgi:UDP-N-acetylmuramoyl-tripeptide--D-alanyl-D-alanine ligase